MDYIRYYKASATVSGMIDMFYMFDISLSCQVVLRNMLFYHLVLNSMAIII